MVEKKIPPCGYALLRTHGATKVWRNCFFTFSERNLILYTCKEHYLEKMKPQFTVPLDSSATIVSSITPKSYKKDGTIQCMKILSPEATAGKTGCFGPSVIKIGHDSAAKMWTLNSNIQIAKGEGHSKADPSDFKEAEFISSVTAGRDETIKVNADGTKDRSGIKAQLKMINKEQGFHKGGSDNRCDSPQRISQRQEAAGEEEGGADV
jgi:hypothetical protein